MARATKARGSAHTSAPSVRVPPVLNRLDVAIEACWLAAAFLVPLIVLPETSFISFTSVPKIVVLRVLAGAAVMLLTTRLAVERWSSPAPRQTRKLSVRLARDWVFSTPAHTTVSAMFLVLTVTAVSAALSLSPYLSVWGKDPGSEGYGLYNMACYIVLGIAVATRLHRPAQAWRLLGVITAAGTAAGLVAVLQNYGFAPLNISATAGVRVTGTAGNPIFLGAILVLTLPISVASLAVHGERAGFRPYWWALAVSIVGIQVAALTFTLSRGPWVGAAAAVPTVLILLWLYGSRRAAVAATAAVASSVAITLVALSTPAWFENASASGAQEVQDRVQGSVSSGSIVARAATVDEEIGQGLSGRTARWSASAELALQRPPVPEGGNPGRVVRALAGYGPDMFRFAFPLTAPAGLATVRTDAAHNDHLNRLVELGIIGTIAYAALAAAIVAAIVRPLRWARQTRNLAVVAVAAGLSAALVGRIVEQSFGIAKPADLTITWLLAGLAAAAPSAFGMVQERTEATVVPGQEPRRERRESRPLPAGGPVFAAVAAAVLVGVAVLTWTKGVNYLRADHVAVLTASTFSNDPAAGLRQIEEAISLAPDVRDYYHRRSLMLQAIADADPARSSSFLREAAAADVHALELNPMSIDSNLAAAYSSWRVAQTGDVQMALRTLVLYERLAELTPQNALVQTRLESLRSVVKVQN